MFRLYDSDGSRCLDQDELKVGLSKYGVHLSDDEVNTIFAAFDADGSGSVNMQELLIAIRVSRCLGIIIQETQRRQYEGHNTPLCYYTDQGPYRADVSMMAMGCIVA